MWRRRKFSVVSRSLVLSNNELTEILAWYGEKELYSGIHYC
jgi:hypothetical protein